MKIKGFVKYFKKVFSRYLKKIVEIFLTYFKVKYFIVHL